MIFLVCHASAERRVWLDGQTDASLRGGVTFPVLVVNMHESRPHQKILFAILHATKSKKSCEVL